LIVIVIDGAIKSSHPMHNPLLLVTQTPHY
jgi:hypothetical protein